RSIGELAAGLEPATARLQVGCATNCAMPACPHRGTHRIPSDRCHLWPWGESTKGPAYWPSPWMLSVTGVTGTRCFLSRSEQCRADGARLAPVNGVGVAARILHHTIHRDGGRAAHAVTASTLGGVGDPLRVF